MHLHRNPLLRWGACVVIGVSALALIIFSASSHAHAAFSGGAINNTSYAAPSIVGNCNGSGPVVASIGLDSHVNVDYLNSGQVRLGNISHRAPGIACYNNTLWLAWFDATLGKFALTRAPSPQSPTIAPTYYSGTTGGDPALKACAGNLYLGWAGTDSAHLLHIEEITSNGTATQTTFTTSAHAGIGISLACLNNQLELAWIAPSGAPYIYIGAYTPNSHNTALFDVADDTSTSVNYPETSSHRPAISDMGSTYTLALAWVGHDNTTLYTNWYSYHLPSVDSPNSWPNNALAYGPALDNSSGTLSLAYTGTDKQIYAYPNGGSFFSVG